MGLFGLNWTFNFKEGGTEALQRNIRNNPQIYTKDREFDAIVHDVFHRMELGDPRILKWDDQFKTIVGLYDQITSGSNMTEPI